MHSTFLKRKHYKNEKINNENLNNERKEEIIMKINGKTNSSLVMSPLSNISSHNQVMNLDSVNCNYLKKNYDDNNKTLLQILRNNLINFDNYYSLNNIQTPPKNISKIVFNSFKENLYLMNKEIKSPLYNFDIDIDLDDNNNNTFSNFHYDMIRNNNKFKGFKIIPTEKIKYYPQSENKNKKQIKRNNNNNENNIINENKNNNINSFIKFKKPELQKKKIFKIEKIFDKEEYENATQIIESKKGNFPLEMQRQLFYKNILKIMTLNNLRQTYIETIKINKSNLLEKTLELMIKNNINETSIKKVLKKKIIRSRHHYIIYSTEAKKFCIDLIKMSKWNSEIISLICEVPSKNIKRWIKLGVIRKKGGGRKTKFPNLEKDLVYWFYDSIDKNFYPIASDIRNKALEICNDKDFLASKGWLDKFIKKYGITPFIKKDRVLINKMGYSEWIKYKYPSGNIN